MGTVCRLGERPRRSRTCGHLVLDRWTPVLREPAVDAARSAVFCGRSPSRLTHDAKHAARVTSVNSGHTPLRWVLAGANAEAGRYHLVGTTGDDCRKSRTRTRSALVITEGQAHVASCQPPGVLAGDTPAPGGSWSVPSLSVLPPCVRARCCRRWMVTTGPCSCPQGT